MVYITGDTHVDFERLDSLRLKKGDTLIICGDFGFIWDGSAREEKILKQLGKKKFNICFIDGTHENFELLDEYEQGVFCGGKAHNISGNLYHSTNTVSICTVKYILNFSSYQWLEVKLHFRRLDMWAIVCFHAFLLFLEFLTSF